MQESSDEFKPPSVKRASSITPSKAERLETERAKVSKTRALDIQKQRIKMARVLDQDRR